MPANWLQTAAGFSSPTAAPSVKNVRWRVWGCMGLYGRDEIQIIAELHALLSELHCRIGEQQVEKHFAELLDKQKRDLRTLEAEACGEFGIEAESEALDSYFHIFTDKEAGAICER
jgi:hypothetical protein